MNTCETTPRRGLRIVTRRGHPVVGAAFVRFARWLRLHHDFPVRVPVYTSPRERLVTLHGEVATASFFAPWDREVEPYIRVATGDFEAERDARGRDDALASFLVSLAHEVVHYQQWLRGDPLVEDGVDAEALAMVERYAETVDHP